MINKTANLEKLIKVANALKEIKSHIAYVGGAVVSIYADDPAADDVRPTKDVDIVVQIVTNKELSELEVDMIKKGFSRDPEQNVICRFKYDDLLVDVMSTEEIAWAPSNRWFKPGFEKLEEFDLGDNIIFVLSVSYFLASKFDTYHKRGQGDPRTSHDFEDIVYILDNHMNLVENIINASKDVKTYLQEQFTNILKDSLLQEGVSAHLPYRGRTERLELLNKKLEVIINDGKVT